MVWTVGDWWRIQHTNGAYQTRTYSRSTDRSGQQVSASVQDSRRVGHGPIGVSNVAEQRIRRCWHQWNGRRWLRGVVRAQRTGRPHGVGQVQGGAHPRLSVPVHRRSSARWRCPSRPRWRVFNLPDFLTNLNRSNNISKTYAIIINEVHFCIHNAVNVQLYHIEMFN